METKRLGNSLQPILLALACAGILLLPLAGCASGGEKTTATAAPATAGTTTTEAATDESGGKVVIKESPAGSEPPMAGDETATTDPNAAGAPGAASPDAEVLGVLRTVNALEVEAAELAAQKATSPQVRQFAQTLAAEHGQAVAQIDASATVKPLPGVLSNTIDQQVGAAIDRLEAATGPQFDRDFMQTQVALHQQVAQLIETQLLPVTQDPTVRQLAESMKQAVTQNLQTAQQIAAGLEASGR